MDTLINIDVYAPRAATRIDMMADQARARSLAWESVKGIREEVNAFYLDGLAMLRRGKAAKVPDDALLLIGNALHDAIGDCVGKMEGTLAAAGCALDPAQVDLAELDAFLESVK